MDDHVKSCCAGFYELPIVALLLGDEFHPGGAALTRKLAASTLIGRDTRVLDVACGRGGSARLLAAHFGCHVIGIDYSKDNIERAIELTEEAGLAGLARFARGDAEQLPFDADSFDAVICECSLCIFPQLTTALSEFHRVLRPGGRLGLSDVVLTGAVPDSLQDLIGRAFCISGALSIDGYREALDAADFQAIRTQDVSRVLSDMIERMERRVSAFENLLDDDQLELQHGLRVPRSKISEARDFVMSGGAGYALITGKKARACNRH
jgi:hypothetical protein